MTCLVTFVPSESVSESETGRTRCTLVFTGAAEDGRLSSGNIRLSARYIAFPVLIFRVLIGSASLRTKDGLCTSELLADLEHFLYCVLRHIRRFYRLSLIRKVGTSTLQAPGWSK